MPRRIVQETNPRKLFLSLFRTYGLQAGADRPCFVLVFHRVIRAGVTPPAFATVLLKRTHTLATSPDGQLQDFPADVSVFPWHTSLKAFSDLS